MITHNTSAQALLRHKIARLEQLLAELDQNHREMRAVMSALVDFRNKEKES